MTRALPMLCLLITLALPAVSADEAPSVAAAIVELGNRERAAHGIAPLRRDERLSLAARHHARNMAKHETMDHFLPQSDLPQLDDRLNRYGYVYSRAAENIAYNYDTAAAVVAGWMASPGHRRNLLDPNLTSIGVGVAVSPSKDPYYCQVFGTPPAPARR